MNTKDNYYFLSSFQGFRINVLTWLSVGWYIGNLFSVSFFGCIPSRISAAIVVLLITSLGQLKPESFIFSGCIPFRISSGTPYIVVCFLADMVGLVLMCSNNSWYLGTLWVETPH